MINIDEAVEKEYKKYRDKGGRPKGKNTKEKKYGRLSISVNKKEREDIQKYADKHYGGNISITIRKILKETKVIKSMPCAMD